LERMRSVCAIAGLKPALRFAAVDLRRCLALPQDDQRKWLIENGWNFLI
jgi:hypothetical protein